MAATKEEEGPAVGTVLGHKLGGVPLKVGDLVTWKGATWRVSDRAPEGGRGHPQVRLKGYDAGPVPVRELTRASEPVKPAAKATTTKPAAPSVKP